MPIGLWGRHCCTLLDRARQPFFARRPPTNLPTSASSGRRDRQGVGRCRIERIEALRLQERRLGGLALAELLQGQAEVVVDPGPRRQQPRRRGERLGSLGQALFLRQQQAERILELAQLGQAREPLGQHPLGVGVA